MEALLLPLLMSLLPVVISSLSPDPKKKMLEEVNKLQSPENITQLANKYYQSTIGGPAYQGALGTIASGANQTAGNLAQSLGARGIGTTGTGAILSSLTPSIVGSQQAALRTKAYENSQQQAMDDVKARIAALTGAQGPSQTQQYLGAGISSFGRYLDPYLMSKYPEIFGNLNTGVPMGQEKIKKD